MPFFGTGGAARDLAYSNSVDGMANAIARSSFKIFEGEKKLSKGDQRSLASQTTCC